MIWRVWLQGQPIVHEDYVYAAGLIGFPGFLEIYLGIVVACLPTLTPIFKLYIKPFVSSIRKSSDKSKSKSASEGWRGQLPQTIGSWGKGNKPPRNEFDSIDSTSNVDLEDAKWDSNVETNYRGPLPTVPSVPLKSASHISTTPESPLVGNAQSIGVRNDFKVRSESRR
ncbi:MAG: hypothetical protein Q9214_003138 [Letrouitia sp. 1 TL-2023]